MSCDEFSVGVLFENSIVCHVFYAIALGAAHDFGCVWFFGVLFCFGLPGPLLFGVGLGLVWFSGLLYWLEPFWFWLVLFGEFDPGSGRTLAACLTHASRTVKGPACWFWMSGERVSNT